MLSTRKQFIEFTVGILVYVFAAFMAFATVSVAVSQDMDGKSSGIVVGSLFTLLSLVLATLLVRKARGGR